MIYGKRENGQKPEPGQRLRIGGMVMPGSVKRDDKTLDVTFKLYDARGVVEVSYTDPAGVVPRRAGGCSPGTLQDGTHIRAKEVLAKHDENYTPPEVKEAMEENHHPAEKPQGAAQ